MLNRLSSPGTSPAQDYYRDVLGLTERAKSAPRLPIADEVEEAEEGDGKVTRLRSSVAAE